MYRLICAGHFGSIISVEMSRCLLGRFLIVGRFYFQELDFCDSDFLSLSDCDSLGTTGSRLPGVVVFF